MIAVFVLVAYVLLIFVAAFVSSRRAWRSISEPPRHDRPTWGCLEFIEPPEPGERVRVDNYRIIVTRTVDTTGKTPEQIVQELANPPREDGE